jgi:hypothetical protein
VTAYLPHFQARLGGLYYRFVSLVKHPFSAAH